MKNNSIRKMIYFSELLDTQAFIVPIKTTFYLSFLVQLSDISLYKFIMAFITFSFEIPLGYFSDRYGDRLTIILSYITSVLSLLLMIIYPSNNIFILANGLMGLSSAMISGAKNTYLLNVAQRNQLDYKEIKIKSSGTKKIVELIFMTVSGILFTINIYYPFIFNTILYILVLMIVLILPKINIKNDNNTSLLTMNKILIKKIIADKQLVCEIIFYSITTTLLVMNFDYYNVIFMRNNINRGVYGLIYSIFMLINFVGIKLFNKYHSVKKFELGMFFCLPIAFILITLNNLFAVGLAIVLQQIVYSYIFIRFDIYLIEYIRNIANGTHFQSLISFWYSLFKTGLLFVISILLAYIDLYPFYYLITLILFITIFIYRNRKNEIQNSI